MNVVAMTAITMVAFAANSLLCRGALAPPAIDPFSFTVVRLAAGALTLAALVAMRPKTAPASPEGSWGSGLALFGYALAFSLAYVSLDAGTGALILFPSVQITMSVAALIRGERPPWTRWLGLGIAMAGLVYLVLPGVTAPDPKGAALMAVAGISWGVYTLRGREAVAPLLATARNFRFALPFAFVGALGGWGAYHADPLGFGLAVASGALASGMGYALWYRALPNLPVTVAAVVQLSIPVIAAVGGILLLGEQPTVRLGVASVLILGGIGVALVRRRPAAG